MPEGGGGARGVCARGGSDPGLVPGGGIPACTEADPLPCEENDRQV